MVGLFQIFLVFLKIGAFTFGGGLAMIPVIKREIVAKGWINDDELADYISVSQTAPGMIAINIATLVGLHLRGRKGALMAVLGVVLPSIIVIILIATGLRHFSEIPLIVSALNGINLVVIVLLVYAIFDIGKNAIKDMFTLVYAILCFALIYFLDVPTYLVILLSFLLGTLLTLYHIYKRRVQK
ncbi:MAG: chromate transporter [Candidatus Izemoplasmatales bacterium]|nr:chromate transporter [Candidatus Izemoplasmatales bacterium]